MRGTSRAVRIGCALLAAAACVNVAAGVAIALTDPQRASDLWTVYGWCRDWLLAGRSLYAGPDASVDYPPNAIVLLAPLALVPARWVVPLWTAVALVLTPVLPWLVLRAAAGRDRPSSSLLVPALLFLCWAAPRTLLQFSLLSMTLAWLALRIADTRWLASGVSLGLALGKPHIAGPIALWMLATGRLRQLASAAVVVCAGWAAYDARILGNPVSTAIGYWHALGSQYAGPDGLVGHTSLRAWIQMLAGGAAADALWIAVSALLLCVLWWLASRQPSRDLAAGGMAVPALFCLWSLLVTYHNGNNLILMLPAFAFLWFCVDRTASRARWVPIALLQASLMLDVPVRLAHAVAGLGPARIAVEHFDRVLVLATLVWVSAVWCRMTAIDPRR